MRNEKVAIEGRLAANPGNCTLIKEMREVNDNIAKTKTELKDEVKIKLTKDERTTPGAHIESQERA